jgi:biotin carboxyl carrier protein
LLEAEMAHPVGFEPSMREKLIVAPSDGRFIPLPPEVFTTEGEWVEVDQPIAHVLNGGTPVVVNSHCRGWMMGMLAIPGQPVRQGEALFWVWGC